MSGSYYVEYQEAEGKRVRRFPEHGGLSLTGARSAANEMRAYGFRYRIVENVARDPRRRRRDPATSRVRLTAGEERALRSLYTRGPRAIAGRYKRPFNSLVLKGLAEFVVVRGLGKYCLTSEGAALASTLHWV